MTVTAGKLTAKVQLSQSRRKALVEGTWDSTALLLANADKTAETAKKLAYTSNFS